MGGWKDERTCLVTLTATSSWVALVSTLNSWLRMVGRNLIITWLSMACRLWEKTTSPCKLTSEPKMVLHAHKHQAFWPRKLYLQVFHQLPSASCVLGGRSADLTVMKEIVQMLILKGRKRSRRCPISQHNRSESQTNLSVDGGCQVSGHLK